MPHQYTTERVSLVFLQEYFESCFYIKKYIPNIKNPDWNAKDVLFWASDVSLYLAMKYSKYSCLFFIIILKNFSFLAYHEHIFL